MMLWSLLPDNTAGSGIYCGLYGTERIIVSLRLQTPGFPMIATCFAPKGSRWRLAQDRLGIVLQRPADQTVEP